MVSIQENKVQNLTLIKTGYGVIYYLLHKNLQFVLNVSILNGKKCNLKIISSNVLEKIFF